MLILRISITTLKAGLHITYKDSGKTALSKQSFSQIKLAGLLESSDQTEALRGFQEVVKMEPDKAEWYNIYCLRVTSCAVQHSLC